MLLFAIGLLVQYRLYSDPEYNARNKATARQEKTQALRVRYINETYDANKRAMMGLPPTPPANQEIPTRESSYSVANAITSGYTWIPILSLIAFAIAFSFCASDRFNFMDHGLISVEFVVGAASGEQLLVSSPLDRLAAA